jgi:hypothetical protein
MNSSSTIKNVLKHVETAPTPSRGQAVLVRFSVLSILDADFNRWCWLSNAKFRIATFDEHI